MSQSLSRLMRTTYRTDVSDEDPDYWGAFSVEFPTPDADRQIVGVDWSAKGEVTVTYLMRTR